MLLAEFEVWHSRPIAPTRRLALGHMYLPVDPAPGFGGLLLAAVVAMHIPDVDDDMVPDVHRLLNEVERGLRVVQPRLRHRFQADRHGLAVSTHRMTSEAEQVAFEFGVVGVPLQQVLGAIYSIERFDNETRVSLVPLLRRAMTWRGPIGAAFISYLMGSRASSLQAITNPRAWALDVLKFPSGTLEYSKKDVMSRYRECMRQVHPDNGGDELAASHAIVDIGQARQVLIDALKSH